MPLDQVVISYFSQRSFISVVLLRSFDLLKPDTLLIPGAQAIEVAPNGISYTENNVEYRIVLDDMFELTVKFEDDRYYGAASQRASNVTFGLILQRVNVRKIADVIIDVKLGELPLRISSSAPCSLHCSNCANEVIRRQQYLRIQPVPVITMRPHSFFCGRHKIPVYPQEDQLFYGLNYVVICFLMLGNGVTRSWRRRRLECSRCRQVVGDVLGQDVAIRLFADALRVKTDGPDGQSPVKFRQIFGHVTATQLMMRLLHDAELINPDKTRLLLKAVRPDGQVHYLQMMVDTQQLYLLRSQMPGLTEHELYGDERKSPERNSPDRSDTSSEGDIEINNSYTSSSSFNSSIQEADEYMVTPQSPPYGPTTPPQLIQPSEIAPKKIISYVALRGFHGVRIKFLFSETDQELVANQEILEQWFDEGAREFRVSYAMIMELLAELNANVNMVAALEKNNDPITSNHPRVSYIIYETDKDFYARQQLPFEELDI
ncbi:hypothetical protein KR200_008398 [Drosophila serrata]|nr:hypothetical protein KR200_008398 [Drosophila serrata]